MFASCESGVAKRVCQGAQVYALDAKGQGFAVEAGALTYIPNMYVCMYVCVYIYIYIHLHISKKTNLSLSLYVCIYIYIYTCVCMYICIYVYIYIYICI